MARQTGAAISLTDESQRHLRTHTHTKSYSAAAALMWTNKTTYTSMEAHSKTYKHNYIQREKDTQTQHDIRQTARKSYPMHGGHLADLTE